MTLSLRQWLIGASNSKVTLEQRGKQWNVAGAKKDKDYCIIIIIFQSDNALLTLADDDAVKCSVFCVE